MKTEIGWHFLPADGKLAYDDGREPKDGEWLEADGPPSLCSNGMHASKSLLDALSFRRGPILCRVEVRGDLLYGSDKFVGRERRVLWRIDATNLLHEFACRCAERALSRVENPDPRSIAAVQAKRDRLAGKIGDEELLIAHYAAATSGVAAVTADYAAYCAAYAAYAAYYAAYYTDADADSDYAAHYAAYYAAYYAAAADWASEREAQRRSLTAMAISEAKRVGVYR